MVGIILLNHKRCYLFNMDDLMWDGFVYSNRIHENMIMDGCSICIHKGKLRDKVVVYHTMCVHGYP